MTSSHWRHRLTLFPIKNSYRHLLDREQRRRRGVDTVTHSKNGQHWPVSGGRGGWLFSPYKRYSLAGVRARERHQESQGVPPGAMAGEEKRQGPPQDTELPVQPVAFSAGISRCSVFPARGPALQRAPALLCVLLAFLNSSFSEQSSVLPSRWPFCTNSRLPASVFLIKGGRSMLMEIFFSSFCCNELWKRRALSSPEPLPMLTPHIGDFPRGTSHHACFPLTGRSFLNKTSGLVSFFRSLLSFTSEESGCHAVTGMS